MARKMRKFSEGGAQGRYDRRMADIEKDYKKAAARKTGKDAEVAAAKREQRIADAKDDLAKRTGADRTATRAAEKLSEINLTKTRKYGAPKSVTPDTAGSEKVASVSAPIKSGISSKPSSFKEAFKDARSRLGAGKTFTFGGKSYTTNIAGESKSSGRTTGANKPVQKSVQKAEAGSKRPLMMADLEARQRQTFKGKPASTQTTPAKALAKTVTAKSSPAKAQPVRETAKDVAAKAAAERKRMSELTGSAKRRANLADMFGMSRADSLEHKAKYLTAQDEQRAALAKSNAAKLASEREKGARLAAEKRREEFVNRRVEGESGAERIMRINRETAKMANGGKVKGKGLDMKDTKAKKPAPKRPMPKEPITGGANTVPLTPERKEFLKEMAKRNATPGMAKGGKMASCGMKKGGKAATKFGAAMKKKSADTMGRAMKKYAKGGKIDGCAVKGKTKGKMV